VENTRTDYDKAVEEISIQYQLQYKNKQEELKKQVNHKLLE